MKLKISSIRCTEGRSVDLKQFSVARSIMEKGNKWEIVYMNDSGDLVLSRVLVGNELKEHQSQGFMSNYIDFDISSITGEPVYQREPNHWC